MNCENRPLLSIIISSYNRESYLEKNLLKMLDCEIEDYEFIVGDNGSTDNTWEVLNSISDARLHIHRNDENLGFENFWLLSRYASGKYFVFVNDRDYIDRYDFADIHRLLTDLPEYDFISCELNKNKEGPHDANDAAKIYFSSRHPGALIYNSMFIGKCVDRDYLEAKLKRNQHSVANIYIVFQILQNVSTVYVYNRFFPIQPPNRERIEKRRKEYYSVPYVSAEYRIKEFEDWIKYASKMQCQNRSDEILLAMFEDSLMTVTWEYYISMKIPGFVKRNNYENHSYEKWISNGLSYTFSSLCNCIRYKRKIKGAMLLILIRNYLVCLKRLIGS